MKLDNPAALSAFAKGDIENAKVASTPGGIEAQEKAGQQELVQSTLMPKEMRPDRAAFEKVGFTFGDEADEIFLNATLPNGWTRAATDHSMHSDILDEKGRARIGVFYKAAFYDRRASAVMNCRYRVGMKFARDTGCEDFVDGESVYVVLDQDEELFRAKPVQSGRWEEDEKQRLRAEAWLKKKYPKADDPTAYWD